MNQTTTTIIIVLGTFSGVAMIALLAYFCKICIQRRRQIARFRARKRLTQQGARKSSGSPGDLDSAFIDYSDFRQVQEQQYSLPAKPKPVTVRNIESII